jgi:glutaredoxin-like protein
MAILKDKDKETLREEFGKLTGDVKVSLFTQEFECEFCEVTSEILNEVADLSDKISLSIYDFQKNKEEVEKYRIDKIPAIAVEGEKDFGIRFFGVPSGYEFSSFVDSIMLASKGDTGLSDKTIEQIGKIDKPIHIQVFVTQTCPYCPKAVVIAHMLAVASDHITADMVGSVEFPHLANKYNIFGVPKTVVNENHSFEGVLPEPIFVAEVLKGLNE